MPIRRELRPLYPADWPEISLRIRRDRAGWRCEECGARHGDRGWIDAQGRMRPLSQEELVSTMGERTPFPAVRDGVVVRITEIQIGTAHLDNDPTNNADDNLAALCRACHLAHDAPHHRRNAAATRRRQMATADLFESDDG